jgi:hypothetical protein
LSVTSGDGENHFTAETAEFSEMSLEMEYFGFFILSRARRTLRDIDLFKKVLS